MFWAAFAAGFICGFPAAAFFLDWLSWHVAARFEEAFEDFSDDVLERFDQETAAGRGRS